MLLRHSAPHLVKAQPFLLPLTPAGLGGDGPAADDRLPARRRAARRGRNAEGVVPGPSRLDPAAALGLVPALSADGLRGALRSYDGRVVDDARLVVALARTAAGHGARVLTRCRALGLAGDGAEVRDELTGDTFTGQARAVVNATGVWAGELAPEIALRPSRGTHLVLREGTLGPLKARHARADAGRAEPVPAGPRRRATATSWSG